VKTYDVKYSTEIVPVDPDPDVVLGQKYACKRKCHGAGRGHVQSRTREEARIFIGALDK